MCRLNNKKMFLLMLMGLFMAPLTLHAEESQEKKQPALLKKIESLEAQLTQLQSKGKSSSSQLAQLLADIEKEFKFALNDLKFVNEEMALKKMQIKKIKDKIRDRDLHISGLEQAKRNLENEVNELKLKLSDPSTTRGGNKYVDRQSYETQMAALVDKLKAAERGISKKVVKAKEPLQQKISELTARMSELEVSSKAFKKENTSLHKELNGFKKERKGMQTNIDLLTNKLAIAEANNFEKLMKDNRELKDDLQKMHFELTEAKNELKYKEATFQSFKDNVANQDKEFAVLVKEKTSFDQKIRDLENKLVETKDSIPGQVISAKKKLQAEVDRLESELESTRSELKKQDQELADLKNKSYDKKLKALNKDNAKLQDKLTLANNKEQNLLSQIDDLNAQVKNLKADMKEYSSSASEYTKLKNKSEDKIQDLSNQVKALQLSLDDVEDQLKEKQRLNASLIKEQAILDKRLARMEEEKGLLKIELTELKSLKMNQGDKLKDVHNEVSSKEEALRKVRERLREMEEELGE